MYRQDPSEAGRAQGGIWGREATPCCGAPRGRGQCWAGELVARPSPAPGVPGRGRSGGRQLGRRPGRGPGDGAGFPHSVPSSHVAGTCGFQEVHRPRVLFVAREQSEPQGEGVARGKRQAEAGGLRGCGFQAIGFREKDAGFREKTGRWE